MNPTLASLPDKRLASENQNFRGLQQFSPTYRYRLFHNRRYPCLLLVKGFTLLELLICISILGILAVLTIPSYISLQENRELIATAEAVAADLRWARSESLKRDSDIDVAFFPGLSWSYNVASATDGTLKTVSNASNPDFAHISLSENLRKDSTTFSSLRGSSEGKNGTIELTMPSGNSILHVVLSNLGRVHICNAKGQIGDYPACT